MSWVCHSKTPIILWNSTTPPEIATYKLMLVARKYPSSASRRIASRQVLLRYSYVVQWRYEEERGDGVTV